MGRLGKDMAFEIVAINDHITLGERRNIDGYWLIAPAVDG